MKILFLHPNFPAQFYNPATYLAQDPKNTVVFATKRKDGNLPGIHKLVYETAREVDKKTHFYMHPLEAAVLEGQAVYRAMRQLKNQGFTPDVIYGHSGWGPTLFMKDLFPKTPLICYFEWFQQPFGSDMDFDPAFPPSQDAIVGCRVANAPFFIDLNSADAGVSPTQWQLKQFPPEYHFKITVRHDGVDTNYYKPQPGAKLVLPDLDLSHVDEVITYATRGMEPYRGFPQFMEAVAILQKRRPNCHVVIAGADRVAYKRKLADGKTYKQLMLKKLPLDTSRIHFTGLLPHKHYLNLLQASSVHVYLTVPFVLSWSMLEAMSTGCAVVASNTAPVTEVMEDNVNGLLVDFFSPEQIADRVEEVLDDPERKAKIRANARATIEEKYALSKLLPGHIEMLNSWAAKGGK